MKQDFSHTIKSALAGRPEPASGHRGSPNRRATRPARSVQSQPYDSQLWRYGVFVSGSSQEPLCYTATGAVRRSSLRFGRNTSGIPASRALSAGRLTPSCCENAAWLSNGSRTGQDRRSGLERRLPELRGMDAGWRRLPSLVLKGSPQSYRSAPETAGTAAAGCERNHARRLQGLQTRMPLFMPAGWAGGHAHGCFSRWGPRRSRGFHHGLLTRSPIGGPNGRPRSQPWSGLRALRSGKRPKSRSAVQNSVTPWSRQRAAIRAS